MGTGWSTVQSPSAIETMPCGSTTSTPEVFQSAAADSSAQATDLTLLEHDFESALAAIPSGYGEGVCEGLRSPCGSLATEIGPACSRERSRAATSSASTCRRRTRWKGSNPACAESRCCDADRAVRGGRAARAVTARPARPTPCVVIGPSRIRLCDRASGPPVEARRHAFA